MLLSSCFVPFLTCLSFVSSLDVHYNAFESSINFRIYPISFHWLLLIATRDCTIINNLCYNSYFLLYRIMMTNWRSFFSHLLCIDHRHDVALFQLIPNVALFEKRIVRNMDDICRYEMFRWTFIFFIRHPTPHTPRHMPSTQTFVRFWLEITEPKCVLLLIAWITFDMENFHFKIHRIHYYRLQISESKIGQNIRSGGLVKHRTSDIKWRWMWTRVKESPNDDYINCRQSKRPEWNIFDENEFTKPVHFSLWLILEK